MTMRLTPARGLQTDPRAPRVILLCGADLVASFAAPDVWRREDVRALCEEHGIVCVARPGADVSKLLLPGVRFVWSTLAAAEVALTASLE